MPPSGYPATALSFSRFGASVALNNGLGLLIGMPALGTSSVSHPYYGGSVFHMVWDGTNGGPIAFANHPAPATNAAFGRHVTFLPTGEVWISSASAAGATVLYQAKAVLGAPSTGDTAQLLAFDPEADPTTISIVADTSDPNDAFADFEIVLRSGVPYLKLKDGVTVAWLARRTLLLRGRDNQGAVLERKIWLTGAFTAPANDSDSDGMANDWESNNGLNPNIGSDAGLDLDGDGLTNLAEYRRYVAGATSGKNPASWDLDPAGDLDGDGVLNNVDARPNDPTIGTFTITVIEPRTSAQY
jgi:hypothetical protein